MSIKDRLKDKTIKIAILVFLLVLAAYGTGYIMGHDSNRASIVIEDNN